MFTEPLTEWLTEMPADGARDAADRRHHRARASRRDQVGDRPGARPTDFVLPPLPNQLFTRDTSAWLYGGV